MSQANPSPIEVVVPADHPEEAGGVCHRVQLAVDLLKLLFHHVSCLTLGLAVGTGAERGQTRKRGGWERKQRAQGAWKGVAHAQ